MVSVRRWNGGRPIPSGIIICIILVMWTFLSLKSKVSRVVCNSAADYLPLESLFLSSRSWTQEPRVVTLLFDGSDETSKAEGGKT